METTPKPPISWAIPPVVRLVPNDAAELASLERACFSHPWSEEQLAYGLREKALHILGMRAEDGTLGAYCSFYCVADEGEIVNIAVAEGNRRRGWGRVLLGAVLQSAAEMGIHRMFLEVRQSNAAAIGLYAAHGFVRTGVRKRYYPDTNEDALVMTLTMAEARQEPS
ncbi:ribosomal-protein-alanine acetyltransferase [Desulfovibrio sp. X2]|uniref:ribosomal protein S18-alanine N-acetyltransferase n=1 Tax=Desulfovibrio sp. X2 TaxID=941449 RepID=UPI000358CDAB|nr:ribosomal protein S18-alanine N-acetyltransferase [Desulfovibrio sp. X2]EPR42305.1 ribosomal-protein-alanine acetyltransferase [Desulfovibrio sp. X2]